MGEAQTYAAYVIKNTSVDYFMGTLTTNSPTEENISNGIIKSMVNNRNLYSSYKDYTANSSVENEIQAMSAPSSAWIYNGMKDCYKSTDWYNGDTYLITTQSYTSYGYMYDEGSRKNYYLLYTDYIIQANSDVGMDELGFLNTSLSDDSITIRDYGPSTNPQNNTLNVGSSIGLSNGNLSGNFSVSYAVKDNDLKISTVIMGNKEIYNHFVYGRMPIIGFPWDYAKSTHKLTAFVIYIDNNTSPGRSFKPYLRHSYDMLILNPLGWTEANGSSTDYNYTITPGCNY